MKRKLAAAPQEAHGIADDTYGHGESFDRLQFGYRPSVAAEARDFHAMFSTKDWIRQRSARYRSEILKPWLERRGTTPARNFEPYSSSLKLAAHWKQITDLKRPAIGGFGEAEDYLRRMAQENLE